MAFFGEIRRVSGFFLENFFPSLSLERVWSARSRMLIEGVGFAGSLCVLGWLCVVFTGGWSLGRA
jgi:hypothetical protein